MSTSEEHTKPDLWAVMIKLLDDANLRISIWYLAKYSSISSKRWMVTNAWNFLLESDLQFATTKYFCFFWKSKLVSDLPFATQQIFLSFLNQSWLIQTSQLHLWECMCLKVSKYFMPLYIWTQKTIYLNKILENAWKDQFCGLFCSRWNQRYSKIVCWSLLLSIVEIKEAKYGLKSNETLTCFRPFWKEIKNNKNN